METPPDSLPILRSSHKGNRFPDFSDAVTVINDNKQMKKKCVATLTCPGSWLPLLWAQRLAIRFPNFSFSYSLNNQLVSKITAVTPPSLPSGPPSFHAMLTAALPARAKESLSPSLGHTLQELPAMLHSQQSQSHPLTMPGLRQGERQAHSGRTRMLIDEPSLPGPCLSLPSSVPQAHK